MNEFIIWIDKAGCASLIYNLFHVLGFVGVFIFVVLLGKKLGLKVWKPLLTVLIVYPIIYFWMLVMFWVENGFQNFGGNNIVRVFVYIPLMGLLAGKILHIDWRRMFCMLAFAPLVQHGISHFACILPGCCAGHYSSWGIYNIVSRDTRFPLQPIEAIGAWIIVGILLYRLKQKSYQPDGLEYPIMLVLFGSSRFVFEFLRDNEKIWLGCSSLSFHALFMLIVGAVWLVHIRRKSIQTAQPIQE